MKLCCLVVAMAFLAANASDSWGQSKQPPQQTPEIKAEQKPDGGLKPEQPAEHNQEAPAPAPAAVPKILSDSANRECSSHCPDAEPEGTEFWPPFHGYRLKVTDTLVAVFTALLFAATIALWWSTRRLVKGTDKTAERQLRAYIIAQDATVTNFGTAEIIEVQCRIRNYGQTPAYDVVGWIGATLNDLPNPTELGRPPPDLGLSRGVIGPGGRTIYTAEVGRLLTPLEFQKIRAGASTIYIFGEITYRDVFNKSWTNHFRFMYGGAGGENAKGRVSTCPEGNYETKSQSRAALA
jgi:hypothetical protein